MNSQAAALIALVFVAGAAVVTVVSVVCLACVALRRPLRSPTARKAPAQAVRVAAEPDFVTEPRTAGSDLMTASEVRALLGIGPRDLSALVKAGLLARTAPCVGQEARFGTAQVRMLQAASAKARDSGEASR